MTRRKIKPEHIRRLREEAEVVRACSSGSDEGEAADREYAAAIEALCDWHDEEGNKTMETEFGWVIERGDSEICKSLYWTGAVNPLSWSHDHLEAIRFARREDAQRFVDETFDYIAEKNARICEHGWDKDDEA